MKTKTRNTIWIISGILLMTILVSAGVLTDNQQTISKYKINDTGMYYNTSTAYQGVSSGTADVVVCRGTSTADDVYKSIKWLSGCDIVQPSTSNDLNISFQSSKTYYFKGNFSFNSIESGNLYDSFLNLTNLNNVIITGDKYTNLNFVYPASPVKFTVGLLLQNTTNIKIDTISIIGNKICDIGVGCAGLDILDSNGTRVDGTSITKVKGFDYIINSNAVGTNDIKISNCIGIGEGTNDVIGGGTSGNGYNLDNIIIDKCTLTQLETLGSYLNVIDVTNSSNLKVSNNWIKGHLVIGTEDGATTNSIIISNTLIRPNATSTSGTNSYSRLAIDRSDTSNVKMIGNVVDGILQISGNKNTIYGNTFTQNNQTSTIYGIENEINDNKFIMIPGSTNSYSLYTTNTAVRNKISNNYIYTSGVNLDGNYNEFSNNFVTNLTYGGFTTGITCIGLGNIINDNKLIVPSGTNMNYGILIGDNCKYADISNNVMINNGGVNSFIVIGASTASSLFNNRVRLTQPTLIIQNTTNLGTYNVSVDNFNYLGNLPDCTSTQIRDITLHNNTRSYTCINGVWI